MQCNLLTQLDSISLILTRTSHSHKTNAETTKMIYEKSVGDFVRAIVTITIIVDV